MIAFTKSGNTVSKRHVIKMLVFSFVFLIIVLSTSANASPDNIAPLTFGESVTWLEQESHRLIAASKRAMDNGMDAFPPQVGLGYEAFWLRDYAYTLEGAVDAYTDKQLTDACRLFVRSMDANGAGVDCIKFDGTPIYKPGFGSMGENPVADGSQFTVDVAWNTYQKTKDIQLLREIIEPLIKTMNAVSPNPSNGLVHIKPGETWDRCPYGFTDTIRKEGDELFCSLLYVQACRQLADLLQTLERNNDAAKWVAEGERVAASARSVFWDGDTGLFRAATVRCREHDIWGSAFAVFLGVADPEEAQHIAAYFKDHYKEIVQEGQIRHLPGGVYWEQGCERDTYQNGGYWATPTGWFVYTLNLADPALADQTMIDLVTGFQKTGACEWVLGEKRVLPNYLASAALPLAGIRAMMTCREHAAGR